MQTGGLDRNAGCVDCNLLHFNLSMWSIGIAAEGCQKIFFLRKEKSVAADHSKTWKSICTKRSITCCRGRWGPKLFSSFPYCNGLMMYSREAHSCWWRFMRKPRFDYQGEQLTQNGLKTDAAYEVHFCTLCGVYVPAGKCLKYRLLDNKSPTEQRELFSSSGAQLFCLELFCSGQKTQDRTLKKWFCKEGFLTSKNLRQTFYMPSLLLYVSEFFCDISSSVVVQISCTKIGHYRLFLPFHSLGRSRTVDWCTL